MFPFVYLAPAYNSSTGSRVLRRSCALFEQDEGTDMKYGDEVSIIIREGHLHKSAAEQQLQQFSSELPKKESGMVWMLKKSMWINQLSCEKKHTIVEYLLVI